MDEYLSFATSIATDAGNIMRKYFKQGLEFEVKEDQTPVTQADKEINDLVIKRISETYPTHSVMGEEASVNNDSNFIWSCDPIDGTVPFLKGIPVSVFSLALVENGVPIVGVVYDPFTNRLYSAAKGKGAFLNGQQMHVSENNTLSKATIDIEWWPDAEHDIDTAMHNLSIENKAYVLHLGSVIAASCLVAAGQYEACIFAGTKGKSVDISAVKIIIEEAGGKVTDLFGDEQDFSGNDIKGAVITNKHLHNHILSYTKVL